MRTTTQPPKPDAPAIYRAQIPDPCKARDQWVLWRYEWRPSNDLEERRENAEVDDDEWQSDGYSKPPLQPDGSYASVDDSETWLSFDDAWDAYQNDPDIDGIGFVFDGNLVGIDWDDVRDPDRPHGSVSTLVEKELENLDSYTEVSPSGTGYHTIVFGALPDGYSGNRADLPCEPVLRDDTPHVEIYDESSSRYFTVTGNHLAGTPETIEDRDDEVDEVHDAWIATDGGVDFEDDADLTPVVDSGIDDVDELTDADEALLETARNADDDGFFADLYDGNWREHTHKWDGGSSHSEGRAALAMKLAFYTGRDIPRMIRLFRNSGLCRGSDDVRCFRDYEAPKAVRLVDTVYSGHDSDGNDGTVNSHEQICERDDGYYRYDGTDDGNPKYRSVSNFRINVLSRLKTKTGSERKWNLEVVPNDEPSYDIVVDTSAFNRLQNFRNEVVVGFSTAWKGNMNDLNDLRALLAKQDAPNRIAVKTIGIHGTGDDRELVTPNGSLGRDGWIDEPGYVLSRGETEIHRQGEIGPRDNEFDADSVAEILRLLPKTRDLVRFIPTLGWFYAAPFRPFIHGRTGQFSNAHVTGETEAGKTSTLELLSQLFGFKGTLTPANKSKATLQATMSSTNTIPVVLDEYKPDDWPDYKVDQVHDLLRQVTRGASIEKGRPDGSTVSYPLSAPVCVSGEQPITGPAESRRAVMTAFTEAGRKGDATNAYIRLLGGSHDGKEFDGYELTDHALAYYQWVLRQDHDDLAEIWRDYQQAVNRLVDGLNLEGVKDDTKKGYTIVLFGARMYRDFARDVANLEVNCHGITEDATFDAVEYLTTEGRGAEGQSHLETLLDVVGRCIADGNYLEEHNHYRFVENQETGCEQLHLHFSTAFDKIKRYASDHDVGDELFGSRDDYHSRIRDAANNDSSPIYERSKSTRLHKSEGSSEHKRCVSIDPAAIGWSEADDNGNEDSDDSGDGNGDDVFRTRKQELNLVEQVLRDEYSGQDIPKGSLAGALTRQRCDLDRDLENLLDKLVKQERVADPGQNGKYRPN